MIKKALLIGLLALQSSLFSDYQAKNFDHLIGMPGFSKNLLEMHFKLYEGYVKNTNVLIEKMKALEAKGDVTSVEYSGLKRMFGFEYDGMRLHQLYFENLGGSIPLSVRSSLYRKIENDYGSFDEWVKVFKAIGMFRGYGWTLLYYDPEGKQLHTTWIESHNMNELVKGEIVLAMDVWEHAYITEYGLNRSSYIDAFIQNIDWSVASDRFDRVR